MNSELNDQDVDLTALVEGAGADSLVPCGRELLGFAEAAVRAEPTLAERRDALEAALGREALVDAAGIVGNFQRMVRIADGTGIPLDKPVAVMSADLRSSLDLDSFGSAGLTPRVGVIGRWLGKLMRPLMLRRLRAN